MPRYRGIEFVDPVALRAQRTLTDALWKELNAQGVPRGARGRIEVFFFAKTLRAANAIARAFVSQDARWDQGEQTPCPEVKGEAAEIRVKLISPEVRFSRDAFMDLVEVAMIAAKGHACTFDGFQVDVSSVRRRPWWRIW
jgi:hypothetical protein